MWGITAPPRQRQAGRPPRGLSCPCQPFSAVRDPVLVRSVAPLCPHSHREVTFPSGSFRLAWVGFFLEEIPKAAPEQRQPGQPLRWQLPLSLPRQMLCDMDQVTAVRFILRQPSPVWLHFTIEELQIFPPGQKVSGCWCCPPCQAGMEVGWR